jgi:hypothetical protein
MRFLSCKIFLKYELLKRYEKELSVSRISNVGRFQGLHNVRASVWVSIHL